MVQVVSKGYKFKLRVLLLVPEVGNIPFTALVVGKEMHCLTKEHSFEFMQK